MTFYMNTTVGDMPALLHEKTHQTGLQKHIRKRAGSKNFRF